MTASIKTEFIIHSTNTELATIFSYLCEYNIEISALTSKRVCRTNAVLVTLLVLSDSCYDIHLRNELIRLNIAYTTKSIAYVFVTDPNQYSQIYLALYKNLTITNIYTGTNCLIVESNCPKKVVAILHSSQ